MPRKNTANEPPLSLEEAKKAALAYVREHMAQPNTPAETRQTAQKGNP